MIQQTFQETTNALKTASAAATAFAYDTTSEATNRAVDLPSAPRRHSARYLVLFGTELEPRAALLDDAKELMAEMIGDDGFIVDSLLRTGVPCSPPAPATLQSLGPRVTQDANLRCFALD